MKNNKNDILNSLSNLSNDEIFTPTKVAKKLIESLPNTFWNNPSAKVLDPCCKTGIFLREIILKFFNGLEDIIQDKNDRINHILKNMIFALPITNMTKHITKRTIYASKTANGEYSYGKNIFSDEDGNVLYTKIEHECINGKCKYCKVDPSIYSDEFENYAYSFIHANTTEEIEKVKKMKFDLIIGNPPYQMKDNHEDESSSAKPIYQYFVENAINMNPDHLIMIIPSRWFGGEKV